MHLRSLISAVALTAAPLVALADGLPAGPAPDVAGRYCCEYVPGPDWTGVYLGIGVGGAWRNADWTFPFVESFNTAPGQHFSVNSAALLGGFHIGANYQISRIVVGAEVSYSAAELIDTVIGPVAGHPTDRFKVKGADLFMVTGRLGFAFDKFLLYGRGGFASTFVDVSAFSSTGTFASVGQREAGWIAGGGLEMRLLSDLLLGIEYNYVSFPNDRFTSTTAGTNPNQPFHVDIGDLHTQAVVARLSVLFGPNSCCHQGLFGKY